MMLNGSSGRTFTALGLLPAGSSHSCSRGDAVPSMKMRRAAVSKAGCAPSTNRWRAPQSATMEASCGGAQAAQEHGHVFQRIGGADRNRLARLDAVTLERGRDTVGHGVELRPG